MLDTCYEITKLEQSGAPMSYKKLEIWQLARELAIDIHRMTLEKLPKFEMYEEGWWRLNT
jgi:hypothetical protein